MISNSQAAASASTTATAADEQALTAGELHQLTLFKWRYSLEAIGFDAQEVNDLMFCKWLYATQRVTG